MKLRWIFRLFYKKDLVSFGQYLLSEERTNRLKNKPDSCIPLDIRLREVHHADIENWKETVK